MTHETTQNPLLAAWTGPFEAPPFDRDRAGPFPARLRGRAAEARAEIAAIAQRSGAAELRQHDRGAGAQRALLDRVASVFSNLAGARDHDELQAIERDIAPMLVAPSQRNLSQRGAVRPHRARWQRRRATAWPRSRSRRACWSATIWVRARRRGARRRGEGADGGDLRAARDAAPRSARTCCATRRNGCCCWSGRPRRPAGFSRRRRGARRPSAGIPAICASRCRARSIEPFLQFSARRDLRENAFPAWVARGENGGRDATTAPSPPKWWRCAPSGRGCSGYASYAAFPPRRHHGEDAARRARPAATVWEPARAAPREEEAALQAIAPAEGGNSRSRPGTGAITPRSGARPSSISTRPS